MGANSKESADVVYQNVAAFMGAVYNQLTGTLTPDPYSDYGDLVDISDSDNITEALAKIDASKNRTITIKSLDGTPIIVNPDTILGPFAPGTDGRSVVASGDLLVTPRNLYTHKTQGRNAVRQTELVNVTLSDCPLWANAVLIRCTAQVSGTFVTAAITEATPGNGTGVYSEISAGSPLRNCVTAAVTYRFGDFSVASLGGVALQNSFNNQLTMKVPLNGNQLSVQHAWCGALYTAALVELIGYTNIATAP